MWNFSSALLGEVNHMPGRRDHCNALKIEWLLAFQPTARAEATGTALALLLRRQMGSAVLVCFETMPSASTQTQLVVAPIKREEWTTRSGLRSR